MVRRQYTVRKDISNYKTNDVLAEANECCLMVCVMMNQFFAKEGSDKRFKRKDLPKINVKVFSDKDREALEIDEHELALTEPTVDENTFTLYVSKYLPRYSAETVHAVLMHEAIHMIVDFSLQQLLGQRYTYPPEANGHIKPFKMICKMCEKAYGYKDLGAEGEIDNSAYD